MMKFFDGEYNELEYEIFEEHLKCCKKCAFDFTSMKEVLSAVETDALADPPEDFEARVMEKVRCAKSAKRQKASKWITILYNSVAVISVLLAAVLMSGKNISDLINILKQIGMCLVSFRSLIQTVFTITMGIVNPIADALIILRQISAAIMQEYVYMVAALILVALGMNKLYTN